MMKVKNKSLYFLLILILVAVYWQWFVPGPKVANDFPLISQAYLNSMMDLPRAWTDRGGDGLGQYAIFSLWSYPASLIMGGLANLGLGFNILERLFFIIPFLILGIFSIWKFLGIFKFSKEAKFLSSIFYLANTYIILLIDGGQLLIVLSYAFFPLCFLAIEKAIDQNIRQKILAGLAVVLLGFLDIRFIFVLLLLSFIRFLYGLIYQDTKGRVYWIKQWVSLGLIASVMLLGFNAFWLIPFFSFPGSQESFARLTHMTNTTRANIGHSILMISPHWYKNIFGNISLLRAEFILLPILAFIALLKSISSQASLIKKRNYFVGFWLLIAVVAIFLSKGPGQPLANIYPFLYSNIPGFSLFRDSTKFFFLLALAYAFLLAVSADWLLGKFKSWKFKIPVIFLGVSYLLFLIRPVFLNQMTGMLSSPVNKDEFDEIAKILKSDDKFSRVFWIPATRPLSYSDQIHPIVEALRMTEKRPFASGIKGTYELFNYLREATYVGELFDVSGIGYIAYPSLDPTKENLHPDDIRYYHIFWNQLSNLSWVSSIQGTNVPVLKVNNHQDKFFPVSNIWWVIGSDKIYNEATKSAKLALSNNALVFAEESPGLGKKILEFPEVNILLFNKNLIDLAATFIDEDHLIFPAKILGSDPDTSGWWKREGKDLIQWRYFLKTKYGIDNQDFDLGGGWAAGEGNLKLKIENVKLRKNNILLARVMESSQSGSLSFYQGEDLVGTINTKAEETNVRWFEVGPLEQNLNEVTVKSDGAINVVNALAILPAESWKSYMSQVESLKSKVKDYIAENTGSSEAKVSFKQINPTKYLVSVTGLKEKSLIVFSANYDKLWKFDGQPPVPVYSLLNGFKVDKDGVYQVSFEAQKGIFLGLIISSLTFVISLIIIFYPKLRKIL